jgi:hypothetical protein
VSILAALPVDLGIGASAAAVVAAAIGVCRWSASYYRRSIGSRRDVAGRLNQLAAGVTTQWVEERFGSPAFVRSVGSATATDRQAVTELIYWTRHAWVQVLTDEHGAVVRFSITVTDSKFKFRIHDLTLNHLSIKLGHNRFSEIQVPSIEPEGYSLRVGAHNFEYSEAYYFGNPGNYQHFVLSHNDSGTGIFDTSAGGGPRWCEIGVHRFGDPPRPDHPAFDPKASYAAEFRAKTTINTLTILGPWRDLSDLAEPRGADSTQVRVLVADASERRRRRRLMRQWNRRMLRDIKRHTDAGQANLIH